MSNDADTIKAIADKLHTAHCIVGYVVEKAVKDDDALLEGTLKAAEDLMTEVMDFLRRYQFDQARLEP